MYRPHLQASIELLTKRLFLRLPLPGDGFALYQALQASRKELVPWIPWVERMSSPEQAEQGVQQAHVDFLQKKHFISTYSSSVPVLLSAPADSTILTGMSRVWKWGIGSIAVLLEKAI